MSVYYRLMRLTLLFVATLVLQACATSSALQVARDQFRQGSTEEALLTLSEAKVSNRDQLLLYLDRGLVSQASQQYEESIKAFELALEVVDRLDYVSIRDQTTAIISSDWAARYKGEYSERLWIHTFQMINYLMLNAFQSAAVEARRAVAIFDSHKDVLKHDKFTRHLMGLSFESAGQINSARVEYRKLAEDFDAPGILPLKSNESELVLLIASGFIEPKLSGDLFIDYDARISFPYYAANAQTLPGSTIKVNGESAAFDRTDTSLVTISQRALKKRGRAIAVRQALRLTAKHNIAESIEDKDEIAGSIARLLLFAVEQADTRSWETLPAYLTLLRIPLSAGQHSVSLATSNVASSTFGTEPGPVIELDIAEGERQFRLVRIGVQAP